LAATDQIGRSVKAPDWPLPPASLASERRRADVPAAPAERAELPPPPAAGPEPTTTATAEQDAHRLRNGLIWTAALAVLLLGVGLAVPDLRTVIDQATGAHWGWLLAGVALEVGSCVGYVITVRLVLRGAPARESGWLAWAEMAFGAVVPIGGAGGLAVGAWAMRAWGIAWSRIVERSAVIFLLTTAVNATVLALAGLGVWAGIGSAETGILYGFVPASATLTGLSLFLLLPRIMRGPNPRAGRIVHVGPVVRRLATWVSNTERVAFTPDWRLLGAVGYLVLDIAVLWACLRAVGLSAPVLAVVMGYQIGYLANLIPIPGGLGVLDGGLLGALLLYGLPAAPTAAAVILYHSIALWVPALGGTYGFARLRRSVSNGTARLKLVAACGSDRPDAQPARRSQEELAA
jgi:uncharacterized membrane protein YbhN (UPF0104 family)